MTTQTVTSSCSVIYDASYRLVHFSFVIQMERCTLARYAGNVLNTEVRYTTTTKVRIAPLNSLVKDVRKPSEEYLT
jgi:hypothetical protein